MRLLRLIPRALLGAALIVLHPWRVPLWLTAAVFVLVFPANHSQCLTHTDAFDLDRDRAVRLLCQPVLAVWALRSTGAWAAWRRRTSVEENPHVRA